MNLIEERKEVTVTFEMMEAKNNRFNINDKHYSWFLLNDTLTFQALFEFMHYPILLSTV